MPLRRDPEKQRAWEQRSRKPLKRTKSLAPKGRGRNGNGRPHDIIAQAQIDAARRFRGEAQRQRVCARCGMGGSFDAHHVVEKSWLKARGLPLFDPDNALRLCDEHNKNDCHGKHTRGVKRKDRLHVRCLRDENLAFAFRLMGPAAGSYLRRRYRGTDPRLEALEAAHGG